MSALFICFRRMFHTFLPVHLFWHKHISCSLPGRVSQDARVLHAYSATVGYRKETYSHHMHSVIGTGLVTCFHASMHPSRAYKDMVLNPVVQLQCRATGLVHAVSPKIDPWCMAIHGVAQRRAVTALWPSLS